MARWLWRAVTLAVVLGAGVPAAAAPPIDVRTYGAVEDDNADDTQAVQAAVDAASARGGAVVTVPAGVLSLSAPVVVRGRNVSLRGEGSAVSHVQGWNGYGGPPLLIGPPSRGVPVGSRTPIPAGVYDGTVGGDRWAVVTGGSYGLTAVGHPLCYGFKPWDGPPDWWSGGEAVTLDLYVNAPSGGWQENAFLFGSAGVHDDPSPFYVCGSPRGLWYYETAAAGPDARRRAFVPVPSFPARVSLQREPKTGRFNAWVNRKLVTRSMDPDHPSKGVGTVPGAFRTHDGLYPFNFGFIRADSSPQPGKVTTLALYGFRVSRAAVYRWGEDDQRLQWDDPRPLNDVWQFLDRSSFIVPGGKVVCCIDTAKPSDGPWVRTDHAGPSNVLLWAEPLADADTARTAVSGVYLENGGSGPALLQGMCYGLDLSDVQGSGGSDGFRSLSRQVSYVATMRRCRWDGFDAGVSTSRLFLDADVLEFGNDGRTIGRVALRVHGGVTRVGQLFAWRNGRGTENVVRAFGHDDGTELDVRFLLHDNEEIGTSPTRAVIEADQNFYQAGGYRFGTCLVSRVPDGVPYFRLNGWGWVPNSKITVDDARAFNGDCKWLLQANGSGWAGRVDASSLSAAKVTGSAGRIVAVKPSP